MRKHTHETSKRSLLKATVYRLVHFFIHLVEAYIAIWAFITFGHLGPFMTVVIVNVFCFFHYLFHERLFARLKWGYKHAKKN